MKETTVFAIGRWMPIHLGHKQFLVKLARTYDKLVIGIGSCYENGTPRNCIPAIEREKLLRKMLKAEGITNAVIIPIEDRETFEEWIHDVCRVCELYHVTHFCTGNKEDILDVMAQKGIKLDVEMINPEDDSDFPYHATDIRNAILRKEWDKLDTMIPAEIKPMVLNQISREIIMASRGEGQAFVPGRQTVDLILTVTDTEDQNTYLLIGKRNAQKIDFPNTWAIPGGGIREFESPIDAAVRVFEEESGILVKIIDNACEPALVKLYTPSERDASLHFTGIYASKDERINGTRGGGSQCFAIHIDGNLREITEALHSSKDMDELRFIPVDEVHSYTLAFDQKRMVFDALHKLGIPYDNGELLAVFDESGNPTGEGVLRSRAHNEGVLHGASHVYLYHKTEEKLLILLQRRSLCKDSFPGCLDMSSGGHIEFGSSFLEAAVREVFEELSLTVSSSDLIELFTQTIAYDGEFHHKPFIDREINTVYALNLNPDLSSLQLQESEVSEVVWMEADELLCRLDANDPELCMSPDEMRKVISALQTL